jgi:hypothetical protein
LLLEINQLASLLILLYYFSVEFVVGDKPVSKFTDFIVLFQCRVCCFYLQQQTLH